MKNIIIPFAEPFECTYGFSTPKYYFPVDNSFFRMDLWKSKRTGEETLESVMCDGITDLSSSISENIKYNSLCYCCYAGYGHTLNAHNKSLTLKK